GSSSASSLGFNGSAGSSFDGSTTPTISSALSSLPASLSFSNNFETGSNYLDDLPQGFRTTNYMRDWPRLDDVLKPVVARYQGKVSRIYFRADAAFAMPEVYEFLEAERIKYAIRLPANQILEHRIGYLLTRPVGRPSNEVRRFHANFTYQAGSWTKPRRVIAKV